MASSTQSHVGKCVGDLTPEVISLLNNHPNLQFDAASGKIKCRLSGHEMPCMAGTVSTYLNGKKYKKALITTYDYDKLKPHIVPSIKKGREKQLFCMLTMRHINKRPDHIEKHVTGRRYQRALARWEECQKTGETFKPYRSRRQQQDVSLSSQFGQEEVEEGEESDLDSLSDLYPAEDFIEGPEDGGMTGVVVEEKSSDDMEDGETSDNQQSSSTVVTSSSPKKARSSTSSARSTHVRKSKSMSLKESKKKQKFMKHRSNKTVKRRKKDGF